MKKEFVCTLDGMTFLHREEALAYLENRFLQEVEKEEGLESVEQTLKEHFPEYRFAISQRPYGESDADYQISASDPFLQGKTVILVEMNSNKGVGEFWFSVKEHYPRSYLQNDEFETLDDAICFYKELLGGAEDFAKKVLEQAKRFELDVADCVVSKVTQGHGTADSSYEVHVQLIKTDGSAAPYATLMLPWDLPRYCCGEPDIIARCIENQMQHIALRYAKSLEGKVEERYSDSHGEGWYFVIDGKSPDTIFRRAMNEGKKVRVEIIDCDSSQI